MEFEINIDEVLYRVVPSQGDETYSVDGDGLSLVLRPYLSDYGVTWGLVSGDADLDLVAQIGELIEDYEM